MLSLIVARDRNGAIGKNGDIPWYAPEDLAFFQRETRFGAVIMGRRTWESLPFKPLKDRLNIVVSSDPDCSENVVSSFAAAVEMAREAGFARIYAIGGAQIYTEAMAHADRLLITEVALEIDGADTFFPEFDDRAWRRSPAILLRQSEPKCEMVEYLRARS